MNQHLKIEPIQQDALLYLLDFLKEKQYQFTVITPLSHQRIFRRKKNTYCEERNLTEIFGWNLPFDAQDLDHRLFLTLKKAQIIQPKNTQWLSNVRVASLENGLFIHSSFPTVEKDTVFFGPDTYRFYYHLKQYLLNHTLYIKRSLELCCGTSAVAITLAHSFPNIAEVYTADINPKALFYSQLNKMFNGTDQVFPIYSDLFSELDGEFDLIFANPPYLIDSNERQYRHGGSQMDGMDLSFKILKEGIKRLSPQGTLFLYTGVAIDQHGNKLLQAIHNWIEDYPNFTCNYEEIDPDVFGEELEQNAYQNIERIAVALIKISAI